MKKDLILLFMSWILILTGCSSTYHDRAFSTLNAEDINKISCKEVQVSINETNNNNIAEEIKKIAELKLSRNTDFTGLKKNYFLTLQISERTFIDSFENKYSLFIYAQIFDENSNLKYQNGFYSISKESIISSKKQFSEIEKITKDIIETTDKVKENE